MKTSLECYNKNKVGKLVAWGSDHFVYNYDIDKVIKFSLIELTMGKYGRKKIIHDYSISKQFFGKYLLETEIKASRTGKYTATIQPKITGHYLSKHALNNPYIKKQFREIMDGYHKLIEAGYPKIDFVGQGGAFRNFMSNIFVTPNNQLFIIDATLLEFKGSGIFRPIYYFLCKYAHWRQGYLIKNFIG